MTLARAPARPAVQALLGAACISPMPVLVALAHSAKAGLVAIVVYRCGLALPVLAVLALVEGRRSRRRPWASRGYAFVAGLLLAIDLVLFNLTIIDVGVGVSTVIGSMYVPFVAGLAWVLLKERPTGRYLITLSVAIGGIVLASGLVGGSGTGRDPRPDFWRSAASRFAACPGLAPVAVDGGTSRRMDSHHRVAAAAACRAIVHAAPTATCARAPAGGHCAWRIANGDPVDGHRHRIRRGGSCGACQAKACRPHLRPVVPGRSTDKGLAGRMRGRGHSWIICSA